MWMAGNGWMRETVPPGVEGEVGLCWVGVGVPEAGEGEGEQWEEAVGETLLEVVKCPGVVPELGLGEVGGWRGQGHSAQASGHPQSYRAGGCR